MAALSTLLVLPAAPATARDEGHGNARMGPANARTTTVDPAAGPDFELPFVCGTTWTGGSRSSHSPSSYTIDFNAPGDEGKPVLASAPGVVTRVVSLTSSYGRYVVIDHGGGYSTLYAHLQSYVVEVGTVLDQGDLLGYLGTTGGSTGPHLHFEQRLDGAYFPTYFTRTPFSMGSTVASRNCNDRPVTGNWDGAGPTEVGVARHSATATTFFQRRATGTPSLPWGAAGATPFTGEYNGTGTAQVSARALGTTTLTLRSADGRAASVAGIGRPADVPITGDWDGNGHDGLGVYRASTRTFYLRGDNGGFVPVTYGAVGDRPVTGDWDGNGRTETGVYNNRWFSLREADGTLQRLL